MKLFLHSSASHYVSMVHVDTSVLLVYFSEEWVRTNRNPVLGNNPYFLVVNSQQCWNKEASCGCKISITKNFEGEDIDKVTVKNFKDP